MASRREVPFRYPKTRHIRRQKPPQYMRYQSYKRFLRLEFEQKCIYCCRPDSVHPSDHKTYAVEHYWPKEHFPEKKCDYDNLFYACAMCNSYKDDYWPQNEDEPFFPNPCDHTMGDHVLFDNCVVVAFSAPGAFMQETLQLNDEALVMWRRSHTWTVRSLETEVAQLKALKKRLKKMATKSTATVDVSEDLAGIEAKIQEHLATLDRHCGTTLKESLQNSENRAR